MDLLKRSMVETHHAYFLTHIKRKMATNPIVLIKRKHLFTKSHKIY